MAYLELAKAWCRLDTNLQYQIAGACLSCTADILAEDVGTENHANRVIWANKVRVDPYTQSKAFLIDVCSNPTIAAALPTAADADVKFVVASFINTYANGS